MVELELEVVVVGLGAETDLFDDDFGGVGFAFFLFLLLLVEVLLVLYDFAYGWVGVGRDHHEVEAVVVCHGEGLFGGHDGWLDAVTDDAYHGDVDVFVDEVLGLFPLRALVAASVVVAGAGRG